MDIPNESAPALRDAVPSREQFLHDVIAGLSRPQKRLPSKYFYDQAGSRLFDEICELPEYYPTRTELSIMRAHAGEMAQKIGPQALVIELGSGSSVKTRMLLDALEHPVGYVPVDISREHLAQAARELDAAYPALTVLPVCADFLQPFDPPKTAQTPRRKVVYFPGSTMGNFEPETAGRLLRHIHKLAGSGGQMLIGLDLQKDIGTLERAYNDSAGVTAAFNLNLLAHINRELGANFNLDGFTHVAHYNAELGRMEMHLQSQRTQRVEVGDRPFEFFGGETIHTENSYKYRKRDFANMARAAGFDDTQCWTDARGWFAVWLLAAR